jgi:hypothetical protein
MTDRLHRTRRFVLTPEAEQLQGGRQTLYAMPGNVGYPRNARRGPKVAVIPRYKPIQRIEGKRTSMGLTDP